MSNELIVITGARNTGKSLLATTYARPSEIDRVYVHDSENSMNKILARLEKMKRGFGRYVDLKARFGDLPGDDDLLDSISAGNLPWVDERIRSSLQTYYQYIIDDLAKNLTPGKFNVYIHDTLEKFEAGMAAWVEANKKAAGVTTTAYGKLWTEGVYPLYDSLLTSIFARGVKTVILCSHLKTPWQGNRPVPNKVVPSGKKILYTLSSMFIWLVKEKKNTDGAPAGLILKEREPGLGATNENEWDIERMLPERIPHCTWKDIRRYLETGCDLGNPAPGETMSNSEREMISELLTDEQMRLMILDAEKELAEAKQQGILAPAAGDGKPFTMPAQPVVQTNPLEAQVESLLDQGKSEGEIVKEVGKPLPLVRAAMRKILGS
jgi:hypothetical protein